jgi:hypothetical protein
MVLKKQAKVVEKPQKKFLAFSVVSERETWFQFPATLALTTEMFVLWQPVFRP